MGNRTRNKHDEEILEAVWTAGEDGDVTVARVREVCPDEFTDKDIEDLASAGMLKLNGDELILTDAGREVARNVVRRHRLAATLMYTALGVDSEERETIACEVEHTLVPELTDGICTLLGHPRESPDGRPIPMGPCCEAHQRVVSSLVTSLADMKPGVKAKVLYIQPKNHDRMHRLTSFGITPGTVLELHQRLPTYCVHYEGTELALDRDVAEDIFVVPLEDETQDVTPRPRGGRRRRRGWFGRGR